jgi:hypothetical protein
VPIIKIEDLESSRLLAKAFPEQLSQDIGQIKLSQ